SAGSIEQTEEKSTTPLDHVIGHGLTSPQLSLLTIPLSTIDSTPGDPCPGGQADCRAYRQPVRCCGDGARSGPPSQRYLSGDSSHVTTHPSDACTRSQPP